MWVNIGGSIARYNFTSLEIKTKFAFVLYCSITLHYINYTIFYSSATSGLTVGCSKTLLTLKLWAGSEWLLCMTDSQWSNHLPCFMLLHEEHFPMSNAYQSNIAKYTRLPFRQVEPQILLTQVSFEKACHIKAKKWSCLDPSEFTLDQDLFCILNVVYTS